MWLTRRSLSYCVLIATTINWPFLALASDASTDSPTKESGGGSAELEEIVVTAQHRTENLQQVPAAITSITGDSLQKLGVTSFADAMFLSPAVHTYVDTVGLTVAIRGIVTTNPNPQGDPAISYNVDDVYYARSQALTNVFFDVDRVEVLNGPQGTTYGRNALAGAVNIITRDPVYAYGAEASLEVGDYHNVSSSAMVNAPLSDTVAVRAAFNSVNHDGYISDRWDDADQRAGRVKVLFNPNDTVSLLIGGNYSHEGGNGPADVKYPFVNPSNPWQNSFYPPGSGIMDRTNWGINAHLTWDFGPATLTYVPAYLYLRDISQGLQSGGIADDNLKSKAVSQELRVVSNNNGPVTANQVQWLAGVFWYKETQQYQLQIETPFTPFTYAPLALLDNQNYPSIDSRSLAFYGQGTYGILDWLRFVGGLRYTDDKKSQFGSETTIAAFPPFFGIPYSVDATGGPKSSNVSFKSMLEADVAPQAMVYGGVTTGYHAGGEFVGTESNFYGPEKITNYEIGIKSRWFDNRLQLNFDTYFYDYTGVQTTVIVPPLAVGVFNAKSARVSGDELNLEMLLTTNDRLSIGVSYEDSKYKDFVIPDSFGASGGTPVAGGVSFAGEGLPFVSLWSGTLGYQHIFDLPGGSTLTAGASSYLRTQFWATIDHTDPSHLVGGYTDTSAFLTYGSPSGKWNVNAYVKNIEDHPDPTYVITNALGTYAQPVPPRTYGIRFTMKFRGAEKSPGGGL